MQVELAIVEALLSANVAPDKAKAAAEAVYKEIDRRYELHSKQLATRGDVEAVRSEVAKIDTKLAEAETRLIRFMANNQRWTIAAIGIIVALVAAIQWGMMGSGLSLSYLE